MTFLNSIKNNSKQYNFPFDHWEYSNALSEEAIDEIVNKWKVSSYNLIKGLGEPNNKTFYSYQVFVDNDRNIDRLLY